MISTDGLKAEGRGFKPWHGLEIIQRYGWVLGHEKTISKQLELILAKTGSLFFLLWTCSRLKVWADIYGLGFNCVNLWVKLHYCNCRYCDEVVERRKTPLFEIDRAHLGNSTHVTVLSSPGWVTFTPTPTFLVSRAHNTLAYAWLHLWVIAIKGIKDG